MRRPERWDNVAVKSSNALLQVFAYIFAFVFTFGCCLVAKGSTLMIVKQLGSNQV